MGLLQYRRGLRPLQGPGGRGRCRRCLLKGCERLFRPRRPQSRYCSRACQQAARRWRRWLASRRYRATDQGWHQRQEQSRRYRQRRQQRGAAAAPAPPPGVTAACEGQRAAEFSEDCFAPALSLAWLLHPLCPATAFAGAAFLLFLLPPGFAPRPRPRSPLAQSPAGGRAPPCPPPPTPAAALLMLVAAYGSTQALVVMLPLTPRPQKGAGRLGTPDPPFSCSAWGAGAEDQP